jgi:serine/threonine-protein kinase
MRFAMTLAAALIVFSGPHHGESLRGFAGSVGPGGRTPAHPHAFWAFARGSGIACSVRAHEVVCAGRGAAVRMNDVGAVRRCHCPQPHATRLLRWGHGMTAGLLGCDVTGVVRCQFADGAGFELSRSGRLKILNPPPVESRAAAPAPGALFTLAGAGTDDEALGEGLPAAVAPLEDPSSLAALPDGSFLAGSEGAVWRVTPQGRLQRVAGQREREGYTGDGGPALAAEVAPDHLAAVPSGGFLLADQGDQRVRMVAADGTITTVAGGGTSKADGVPALRAALGEPLAIAALPGGGFAIDDGETRVREVAPDGSIRTVAGGGQDDRIHGEPATAADLQVWDIAAEPDGTLLLVDGRNQAIDRVARDGTIHVAARPPRADGVEPTAVTALPDGGFAFAATVADDFGAGSTRVYRVGPDGIVRPVAGGGPFAPAPLAGLTRRGDGGAATAQPLARAVELSALPDGGLLLSTDATSFGADGDVVTYIAPDAPAVLAVAMRRDGARVFRPGRPNAVHVALTLPATLTLRSGGRSVTRALPAGQSTVALPGPLSPRPHAVTLAAVDSAGRGAYDHAAVFPAGWLPEETARIVADAVAPERVATICKRFAGGRIDCQDDSEADPCVTISIRYARERVRWGTYRGCEPRAHPRYSRPPRPLGRRDWHCEPTDEQCEPALLGRVREADIVPQS